MKREAEQLKAQQAQQAREERIQGRFNELAAEFPAMKELYPNFDMAKELENPKFAYLIDPDAAVKFSLKEAYLSVHGEDILAAGMQPLEGLQAKAGRLILDMDAAHAQGAGQAGKGI